MEANPDKQVKPVKDNNGYKTDITGRGTGNKNTIQIIS